MPLTAPYDTLENVIQTARVRLNDAITSIQGDILTDTAAFTGSVVNAAWRRLQELLANYGFAALNREMVALSVAPCSVTDLGTFVWFNWVNYSDGSFLQSAPVLPQDMIAPLDLYERVSGSGTGYILMDQVFNGLPSAPRSTLNRLWEWRQETIYMPGATGFTDIRLRYAGYLADFLVGNQTVLSAQMLAADTVAHVVDGTNIANNQYIQIDQEVMKVTAGGGTVNLTVTRGQFSTSVVQHAAGVNVGLTGVGTPVPIMRSLNSFAWFLCSEVAKARGDLDAGSFEANAQQSAEYIFNRDPRRGKSIFKRSEYGKMQDEYSPIEGPASPRGPQKG